MESRAKLLGHPAHPMFVIFPLGLFISAVVFDLIHLGNGNRMFATVAFWNISAGLIGGLIAAVFGLIDWMEIPSNTRASRIGLLHGVGNLVLMILFAASWYMRWSEVDYLPSTGAMILGFCGVA